MNEHYKVDYMKNGQTSQNIAHICDDLKLEKRRGISFSYHGPPFAKCMHLCDLREY